MGPNDAYDLRLLLDEGRWSLTQKIMLLLASAIVICDGIDNQLMGVAVPAIAKDWGLARGSFATVLAIGLFGIAIGAAVGGPLGDRFGRRKMLISSLAVLGLASLGIAFTHTIPQIVFLRLIVGIGIGAAYPNATAYTAECTPRLHRPLAVTIAIVSLPIGGIVAGSVAAPVLVHFGWRPLFLMGGALPVILALFLLFAMPESPHYLLQQPAGRVPLLALLRRMGHALPEEARFTDVAASREQAPSAIAALFGEGQRRDTFCLWAAFFASMLSNYLVFNWLPSLMTGLGFGLPTASFSIALFNGGAVVGALALGFWVSKRGSHIPLLVTAAAGVICGVVLQAMRLSPTGSGSLLAAITCLGLFVGALTPALYALAASLYVARIRATGVAAAITVGRMGAIASAFLGANLLHGGKGVYFLTITLAMAGALLSLAFMRKHIVQTAVPNRETVSVEG